MSNAHVLWLILRDASLRDAPQDEGILRKTFLCLWLLAGAQFAADVNQREDRLIWVGAIVGKSLTQQAPLFFSYRARALLARNALEKVVGQAKTFLCVKFLEFGDKSFVHTGHSITP